MYNQTTNLNCGFVILSPDVSYGHILTTYRSIRTHYPTTLIVCAVAKEATEDEIIKIQALCPVYRGNTHFTSLINAGVKNGHKEWNMLVTEGAIVTNGVLDKYARFVESEKDILFAILPDYDLQGKPTRLNNTFYDCSLNGVMVHQKTYKKIGNLTNNPLEISRVMWALEAIKYGCRFKAILGIKII
jgi:hypothetical protein